MSEKKKAKSTRREFFKRVGLGAGVVGTAAVAAASMAKATSGPDSGLSKAGYRETEHVKKYYELSRF